MMTRKSDYVFFSLSLLILAAIPLGIMFALIGWTVAAICCLAFAAPGILMGGPIRLVFDVWTHGIHNDR